MPNICVAVIGNWRVDSRVPKVLACVSTNVQVRGGGGHLDGLLIGRRLQKLRRGSTCQCGNSEGGAHACGVDVLGSVVKKREVVAAIDGNGRL